MNRIYIVTKFEVTHILLKGINGHMTNFQTLRLPEKRRFDKKMLLLTELYGAFIIPEASA